MTDNGHKREELEFLLSQYVDGDLDPQLRSVVERRLADDAELAAVVDALRHTDRLIRTAAGPVPALDWERFTDEAARRRDTYERAVRRQRLIRIFAPLSAAAAIALLVTLYATMIHPGASSGRTEPMVEVVVERTGRAPGPGPAYAEVSVVRAPGLQIIEKTSASPTAAAVAVAAAGTSGSTSAYQEPTPCF